MSLLAAGADVAAINGRRSTTRHLSIQPGSATVVRMFWSAGAALTLLALGPWQTPQLNMPAHDSRMHAHETDVRHFIDPRKEKLH